MEKNRSKIEKALLVIGLIVIIIAGSNLYYISALMGDMRSLLSDVRDLSSDISTLTESVASLASAMGDLADTMGDLAVAVGEYSEAMAALEERIAAIEEALKPAPIVYGGTLTLPLGYDLSTLNPLIGTTASEWSVYELVYETLLVVSENWTTIPWLAYAVDVSEDGVTWTFHLVDNATWHDGEHFTSNDVKFTFEYCLEKGVPGWETTWEKIEKIEAPDDYTVIFYFKKSSATFFADMSSTFIIPQHIWKDVEDPVTYENSNPIGMGPFKFKRWIRGQYIELEANDDYWYGRPYIDKVIFRIISTYDATVFAFERGDIDAMGIQSLDVPKFIGKKGVKIYEYSIANTIYLAFNLRTAPMSDKQFRYAVAHAIDKEKINELTNHGFGIIWEHFWPEPFEAGGWINPNIATYEYNVTRAVKILDDAGYIDVDGDGWREAPDGSKISLKLLVGSGILSYFRPAQVIVENLQGIGLDVSLEALEVGTWVERLSRRDFTIAMFGQGVVNNDPDIFLYGRYHSSQVEYPLGNYEGFINATYDELCDLQRRTIDVAERQLIVWQMEAILARELPTIVMPNQIRVTVVNTDKFEGWVDMVSCGPVSYLNKWSFLNIHLKD